MSLVSHFRGSIRRCTPVHGLVMAAALLSLVLAPFATLGLPHPSAIHATTSSAASHPQRPCFDGEGSQGITPTAVFLPDPPRQLSDGPAPLTELRLPFSTKGSHYNRPPPLA